ncbi:MAG: GxxExxY protein [Bacteroidales bacterium]|nr:GxxExxY protein [Bacteroidales bacterium]
MELIEEKLSGIIIDCALKVHKALGPGLLEKCYEGCLEYELKQRGLKVERQKEMPVNYKGVEIKEGYTMDLLVEDKVVIELKSVDQMHPIFTAQTLTYMKLGGYRKGLLINFNEMKLKDGLHSLVN